MPLAPLRRVVLPADPLITPPGRGDGVAVSPLARWGSAVAGARDACLVLDQSGAVVSTSIAAAELLGQRAEFMVGRPLLSVINLVDFETGEPSPDYAPRIPPLRVLKAPTLLRGLLRIAHDGRRITIDAISAPLRAADDTVTGSISFLASITPG
jgi:PAS domain S-box-containing protein